jgi:4-hydroxybenzoate polyprenyltransferase
VYFPLFAKLLFALFFLLIIFYSAKPIRLKAKPFVDSLSNIMLAFPAFIGVYQITNMGISLYIVIAVLCWTTAMYFFTSAQTIETDKQLHLKTSAIKIGRWNSLLISIVLWFIAAICATITNYFLGFLLLYPLIPIYMLVNKKAVNDKVYSYFPLINLGVGVLLVLIASLA